MESQDIGQENTWLCRMGQVPEMKGKDHRTQKAEKKKKTKHAQCWRKEERRLQKSGTAGG